MSVTEQSETLLLKQPTVSAEHVAFLYAGDIWIADRDGGTPRRLTVHEGEKSTPMFSPDGQWIAFSGNYDGNTCVYTIPSEGGSPRRLTYHPGADWVRGWTPDGQHVLFASSRDTSTLRYKRLYTVPIEGGFPEPLPLPMAERGAYSPDGSQLAYTRIPEPFWSWKRYRGGMTPVIWVFDFATQDIVEIPHSNASDTFPCWMGDTVYFLSDRNHTVNLFGYDPQSQFVKQLTHHDDFDIRSLTSGAGVLAYEQAGRIHIYDPAAGAGTPLKIRVAADLPFTRPHYQRGAKAIRKAGLSPTGARAVFEVRGEILTVPAKKGDIRNLTRTPGVHERDPAWSPDGQRIAYFSDASGEYELVIADQTGLKEKTFISLGKKTFFYSPIWSPDSTKIVYTDKALNLYTIDLDTKTPVYIDKDGYDHPDRTLDPAWSPDSKWIAYTKRLNTHIRAVFLYELSSGETHQVTDGLSDTTSVCFSPDGKYLFFTASVNYGLNTGWLDMSSYERPISRSLYVAVLSKDDPSPLAPESDEEAEKEESTEEKEKTNENDKGEEKKEDTEKKPIEVKIDLENLGQRILALPVPARDYDALQAGENKLFYLELLPHQFDSRKPLLYHLRTFDLEERKDEVFLEQVRGYWLSADGKKLLYQGEKDGDYAIVETAKKPENNDGKLKLSRMELYVEPRAEWQQMFNEVRRIQRDYFYDAHMHGVDWNAVCAKYEPFLDHVGHRSDLNFIFAEMMGELVAGHAYVGGGDVPQPEHVQCGLLGADFEIADGYYHIKHIYSGLNWHPELRSPLTEPGVNVSAGEVILAVNGQPLRAPDSIYRLFEKTAGCLTELLVSPSTDEKDARTVTVKPINSETALRHWFWVESNRKKVDELSDGRVAYVYMTNTSIEGYHSFNRYYFSQLDKQAVVLDERFNGGGSVADYVIDMLGRPLLCHWATREGKIFHSPNASIFGPKVMIVNEYAGSGGDAMPLFFRRRGLGKLVGKRTWGGLIGIYDYPVLMDGGMVTAPRMAIFSPDNEWEVENVGISPDIEVEMTPKLVIAGRDPQLEKAVEIVLAELAVNPPTEVKRPAPADRTIAPEK
ncbi:MAG: PD40 domain-containing protein [Anaerolineae bacterium]|nr:PD40 domain-containing protein [Anaerolineae bacterium]